MLGILVFALVAGALTNEIIVLTTDNNIYSTEGITADSSIGALGMSYYAVKHLLLSSTPATQFKNLATDEAVESLRNGSIDVIIGPYATLIEARLRTIADDKERTTREAAHSRVPTASTHGVNVYVSGPQIANARHFSHYIVFRQTHFQRLSPGFPAALRSALDTVQAPASAVSIDSINLPLDLRGGTERVHADPASSLYFVLPALLTMLGYALARRHEGKKKATAMLERGKRDPKRDQLRAASKKMSLSKRISTLWRRNTQKSVAQKSGQEETTASNQVQVEGVELHATGDGQHEGKRGEKKQTAEQKAEQEEAKQKAKQTAAQYSRAEAKRRAEQKQKLKDLSDDTPLPPRGMKASPASKGGMPPVSCEHGGWRNECRQCLEEGKAGGDSAEFSVGNPMHGLTRKPGTPKTTKTTKTTSKEGGTKMMSSDQAQATDHHF